MKTLDEKLREYAQPRQWELLSKAMELGSDRAAAKFFGIHKARLWQVRKAVLAKAAQYGYAPDNDMTHPTAPGFKVKGTSTLYDEGGNVRAQWVKTTIDQEQQAAAFQAALEAMAGSVERVPATKAPKAKMTDVMVAYPIGDHHLGMLAWDKETGDDYDISISEKLLRNAMDHLVDTAPASEQALIAVMGDFMHYDSFKPTTPTSGNLLDADSRFPKMVGAAIKLLRYVIERAREKHAKVHVIVEIGNHDLSSSIFLQHLLANVYEKEPRVTIDISPRHFHFFQFGKNMIMTHHGHGVKPEQMPIIMATDQPQMWGSTEHRVGWFGHVHHKEVKGLVGATIESHGVLAPEDAYAAQKGYRSKREMKSITFHREHGEVARNTVTPSMFQ